MHYAKELLDRYYVFYRAERTPKIGHTTEGCIRPLKLATDIIVRETRMSDAELIDSIAARLALLMRQIHAGTASVGRWVSRGKVEQDAIYEFSRFLVEEYFRKALRGDHAKLTGNSRNLLLQTCDFLYRRKEDMLQAEACCE